MLSILLMTDWKTEMSRFAQLTVALLLSSILVSRQYYNTLFFVYVYLDVLIDQHLSWKRHIDFVSKKISKSVGIIAKARFYLSAKTLMTLYYSLVYLFLTYCNVAWSSTYCSNLNCIYLLQKRIVRLITKAHYLANTAPLFSHLKVLDIFSINSFSVATLIYCNHHNLFVTCS